MTSVVVDMVTAPGKHSLLAITGLGYKSESGLPGFHEEFSHGVLLEPRGRICSRMVTERLAVPQRHFLLITGSSHTSLPFPSPPHRSSVIHRSYEWQVAYPSSTLRTIRRRSCTTHL